MLDGLYLYGGATFTQDGAELIRATTTTTCYWLFGCQSDSDESSATLRSANGYGVDFGVVYYPAELLDGRLGASVGGSVTFDDVLPSAFNFGVHWRFR